VRVFGKDGRYPSFSIETPGHLLVTSPDRCWSAVVQPTLDPEWDWSERISLTPEEIRLFSAVTLSEPRPWENGRFILTHRIDGGEPRRLYRRPFVVSVSSSEVVWSRR
jgi:hypothetical protein